MNKNFIAFIVEGEAEKNILEILIKNNKLKAEYTPLTEYGYEISVMKGTPNMTYSKWKLVTNVDNKTLIRTSFVLIGDSLEKNEVKFDKTKSDVEELEFFTHEDCNYEDRIKYVTINPKPEYLILANRGLINEYEKNKNKTTLDQFIYDKVGKKWDVKSSEFWKDEFNNVDELIESIKKLKKTNSNKIISLIDIIEI